MKSGDLVRWVGFPDLPAGRPKVVIIGMITRVYSLGGKYPDKRIDVMWGPGSWGKSLYPSTVVVINEDR